jgi:hypothetical protein
MRSPPAALAVALAARVGLREAQALASPVAAMAVPMALNKTQPAATERQA